MCAVCAVCAVVWAVRRLDVGSVMRDRKRTRIPSEQVAKVLAWRSAGWSTSRIAHALQRPGPTISNILRRHGVQSHRWISESAREEIIRLRREGVSTHRIASRIGTSRRTVMVVLRAAGLTDRSNSGRVGAGYVDAARVALVLAERNTKRIYARENGWPETTCPAQVRILNRLVLGPATRVDLSLAAGIRRCRTSHHISRLVDLGWVVWIHIDGVKRLYSITLTGLANWSPPITATKEECHG